MKRLKLNKQEKAIEKAWVNGEYLALRKNDLMRIADAIAARKKDAVLNIRVNSNDLKYIRKKASRLGIRYQTFVSEILHQVAQA